MKKFVLFFVACAVLAACSSGNATSQVVLQNGAGTKVVITAEIAKTPAEQEKGLMDRKKIDPLYGMLFVFQDSQLRNFWMKNTLVPLDILFFDAQKKLVSIAAMVPCTADPCVLYSSNGPAQYALEVPAGFFAKYGQEGWTVSW